MDKTTSTNYYKKRYLAFISAIIAVIVVLMGYFYYKYEEKLIVNNQKQDLEAIAELKIEQINKWMEEKIQNADNVSKNQYSLKEIDDLINGKGEPGLRDAIINRLKYRVKSFQYENIYLTNPEGKVILSADPNDNSIDTAFSKDIKLAREKRVTMFSDFRFRSTHNKIHLLVISPNINSKNELLGFLVFAIDPAEYLFPLIQKWPTESKTAETTFYEKDGTDILIINELRHQPNTALKLRIPMSNVELPAVQAVYGARGLVDGVDYRGHKVLAYVTQIKGTDWYINAKIDKDEIFAELKYRAYFISIVVILMVLFTGTLAAFVYNAKQRFILQSLIEKDNELRKSQELLTVMGSVAKIGGWEFDAVTKKGSWTKEVAMIHEVNPEDLTDADFGISFYVNDSKEKIVNAINEAIEKGLPYDLELEMVTAKGNHKWVRTIGEPLKENGKVIKLQGSFQDITESKLAKELLRESEEKYRILFESNNDGISIFYPNPDGTVSNFVDVNEAAAKMLGFTKEEYKQLSVMDLGEDVSTDVLLERQKALMANKTVNTETRIKHKSGKWIDVEITITTIIYNNRIAIMNIVRDISERKRAIEALENSEERLRLAMQATNQGWLELNIQTSEILVSDSYMEILGYKHGELDSSLNNWLENLHPEDLDGMQFKFKECVESGEVRSMEYRRKTKSGDWKWLRSVGKVVEYDAKGNPLKMSGTHMDISARKLAEEELRVSEENFTNLVESMPEGYYRSTPEGKFLYVNPAFVKMLGFDSKEELLNVYIPSTLYFTEQDRNEFANTREDFISEFEMYRLKRKDGTEIWLEDYCRYIKDENGNTLFHEGVCRDITARRKADEELIKAKERAEELSRIKSNFLANMSHELRTPMVGILGFSEVLQNSLEDEELKHYAGIIHKGGTRLMDTLNLILNISAIELDNVKVTNEEFDLISEVKEVLEIFNRIAAQKNLSLSYESGFDKKLINSDRKIVSQILNNLVNNAIKYTTEGSVLVKVEDLNKNNLTYVAVKVIDTGIGIPEDKRQLIWEEFRQVSEGLSRGFEGTGLGLSITKKFIDMIGGDIFIEESLPGVGTTFTVLVPVDEIIKEKIDSGIKTPKSITGINAGKTLPSILYVDDDSMSVDLVKVLVKSICNIDSAVNGMQAIEKARTKKYDVILMDINLGKDIDGLETTAEIRKISGYENTPVIAVTALAMKYDREKFLAKGCTHYISKPFLKEEFVSLVSEVLAENAVHK